ncbi:hypothetical protein C8F01DRAFT_1088353 [Mycena amicta]|nr:hypothetical protein C8F01DRAFT_1088353 [Mycena amicta]
MVIRRAAVAFPAPSSDRRVIDSPIHSCQYLGTGEQRLFVYSRVAFGIGERDLVQQRASLLSRVTSGSFTRQCILASILSEPANNVYSQVSHLELANDLESDLLLRAVRWHSIVERAAGYPAPVSLSQTTNECHGPIVFSTCLKTQYCSFVSANRDRDPLYTCVNRYLQGERAAGYPALPSTNKYTSVLDPWCFRPAWNRFKSREQWDALLSRLFASAHPKTNPINEGHKPTDPFLNREHLLERQVLSSPASWSSQTPQNISKAATWLELREPKKSIASARCLKQFRTLRLKVQSNQLQLGVSRAQPMSLDF